MQAQKQRELPLHYEYHEINADIIKEFEWKVLFLFREKKIL